MADDMGERTEDPTARRMNEARNEGRVARSQDLASAIVMLGATLALAWMGVWMLGVMTMLMRHTLEPESLAVSLDGGRIMVELGLVGEQVARVVAPLMAVMVIVAAIAQIVQVGFMLSSKVLSPKWSRLNVIAGFKKFASLKSAMKGVMDLGKFIALGGVVTLVVMVRWERVMGVSRLDLGAGLAVAGKLLIEVALWALLVLLILGVIDLIYQRWQHKKDLKMTKQEVKDERKSEEGDTEMKGKRRSFSRQIAMQRLQQDVPEADVVVTNPTHFAVALKYDASSMAAPRVVAKGADYLALKIRYIANAHGVPIVERAPLARALYREVDVGREVNLAHYEAVAEVLAYVYRLEGRAAV